MTTLTPEQRAELKRLRAQKPTPEGWQKMYDAIPSLLDEVESLERERDEEREAHEQIADHLLLLVGTADGSSVSAAQRAAVEIKHLRKKLESAESALRAQQPRGELIYLATPYSHPDKAVMERRFNEAAAIAAKLMGDGHFVFCPITHTHPIAVHGELPRGWDFWERYDRIMLTACTKVIVAKMDGWGQSKGIAGELRIAAELGLPIEYLALPPVPAETGEEK